MSAIEGPSRSLAHRLDTLIVPLGVWAFSASAALGAEEAARPSLFSGDLGNIIWSVLTFVAVLVVLGKFAWNPILNALKKREEYIRDSLEKAKRDREALEARMAEYEKKLEHARAEASAIVEEGRRDAEVTRRRIEEEAHKESRAMIARAKREITLATESAVKQIYTLSADLATNIASRIIRKELDPKEHDRLISEALDELQEAGANGKERI